jgi:L-ribulose-5-phosphate 3-epimerase UlaE
MIDIYVSKIQALLDKEQMLESDVVYTFVLIRKILEFSENKNLYHCLRLHCNWILHIEIKNTRNVAQQYKKMFIDHAQGHNIKLLLWEELRGFLDRYGVTASFFVEWKKRVYFEHLLLKAILNQPLVFQDLNKRLVMTEAECDPDFKSAVITMVGYKIEDV